VAATIMSLVRELAQSVIFGGSLRSASGMNACGLVRPVHGSPEFMARVKARTITPCLPDVGGEESRLSEPA